MIATPLQGLGVIIMVLFNLTAHAQEQLTIEDCYKLAEANYPLAQQLQLIEKTRQYTIDNISKGIYPQISLNAQATYQSDVTKIEIPLPNVDVPSMPKDQYKVYGEVAQSLTDFPLNKVQRDLKSAEAEIQTQNIQVELYKLHDRINQLFFGTLLIDEQLKQSDLLKSDINRGIKKTES
jgi:hypothetical protein